MGDSKEIIENQEVELKQEETVVGVPAQEEEEVETPEAREAFITDWNERNKEFGEIRMEKPTPEEVKAVMDEYTEKVKDYNERQFELADENNALRVARFLRVWNRDDVQWENNLWQGTIMFDQILTEFINSFDAKNKKPLKVGYQPLVYLYLTMRNMKGQGLESALHMQKINNEFVPILDTVGDFIEEYQNDGKKLELLQQKWHMFELGYYVTLKEPTEEE